MSKKRLHTTNACEACRKRKCKCVGKTVCQRCMRFGLKCVFVGTLKKRGPQKKKFETIICEKKDLSENAKASSLNEFNSLTTKENNKNQGLSLPSLSQLGLDKFFVPSIDDLKQINRTGNKHYFKSLKELQQVTFIQLQSLNPSFSAKYNFIAEPMF
ncbi:7802_t:CDS:2 [Ambispora gerdemannii]|uniref:7802_t:CDS:1 n=1 Tax=Ambispora gerdemannii TaxID=144530 RepID=A0A9N9E4X5_9GLOM|nr:7802_t:CDS:2 [Ambispora gerdemannii]